MAFRDQACTGILWYEPKQLLLRNNLASHQQYFKYYDPFSFRLKIPLKEENHLGFKENRREQGKIELKYKSLSLSVCKPTYFQGFCEKIPLFEVVFYVILHHIHCGL